MKIEAVNAWKIDRGIGHVIDATINGWLHTLCNTAGPGHETTERPKRICRKCWAALKVMP